MIYQRTLTDDYEAIIFGESFYVPYCAIEKSERGAYLGHIKNDPDDEVYEFRGYSSDEWIISYLNLGNIGGEAMLYREINVTEIPDGLSSEYDWNK